MPFHRDDSTRNPRACARRVRCHAGRPLMARAARSSKRLLRAAGGAEAALLGKHALQPVVGRAVRRALHDDTQMVLCMRMRMFR